MLPASLAALLLARGAAASSAGRRVLAAATAQAAGPTAARWAPTASSPPSTTFSRGVSTSGRAATSGTDGKELDRGTAPSGDAPPAGEEEEAAVTTTAASTPAPEEVAAAAFATPTTPLPPTHPRPPPARVTVSQPPPSALPSPIAGYAELGVPLEDAVSDALVGGPAAAAAAAPYVVPPVPAVDTEGAVTGGFPGASAAALTIAAAGRIHPGRLFYPGMTYSPSDLVAEEGGGGAAPDGDAAAKASSPAAAQSSGPATTPGFTGSTVAAFAARPPVSGVPPPGVLRVAASDFRNAPLLASLVSATGKLPPRRRTRLAAKDHRALARSIKLARQLALIAPLGRETVDAGPKKFVRPPKRVWREGEGGGGGGGVAATG